MAMTPRVCLHGVSRTLTERIAALSTSALQLQLLGTTLKADARLDFGTVSTHLYLQS